MSGNGLVVFDLNGGDAAYTLVDSDLWEQILELHSGGKCDMKHYELIGWLTCDDPDVDRPEGAPDRRGKILKTWYTQTWVVEKVLLDNVVGILTLPCF